MTTPNDKNIATVLHLSALTQYIIPFGNYVFPIVIWSTKKNESEFVDYNGKQVLNFQLSLFVYSVILCLVAVPIFIYSLFQNVSDVNSHTNEFVFDHLDTFLLGHLNINHISGIMVVGFVAAFLFFLIKIIEFVIIILAAVKASNGESYKYPLSIPFLK